MPSAQDNIPYIIRPGHEGTYYTEFLPALCSRRKVENYLEIGVASGGVFEKIKCKTAVAVDPAFSLNFNVMTGKERAHFYQITSDRFFEEVDVIPLFGRSPDLVFLDGMHHFEFLVRDFYNTESVCGSATAIVMHDCFPLTVEMTDRDINRAAVRADGRPYYTFWTGDVWKIIPILREYRTDLTLSYLDAAPTGLLCVTGLDPSSTVLRDRYDEIINKYSKIPETAVSELYSSITMESAAVALAGPLGYPPARE